MTKINIYDNIVENVNSINSWINYDTLPVDKIADKTLLDDIGVIEIIFDGTHGNNLEYNTIAGQFHEFMKKYLLNQSLPVYYYGLSSKELKNRIRSYKGYFPKEQIDTSGFIQDEFDIASSYSIIAGLIKLTSSNIDHFIQTLFFCERKCLILTNEKDFYSKKTIKHITTNLINQSSYVIDYVNMCTNYCKNGSIIIREGGDGGDQEFSWQMFVEKNVINEVVDRLNG